MDWNVQKKKKFHGPFKSIIKPCCSYLNNQSLIDPLGTDDTDLANRLLVIVLGALTNALREPHLSI